MLTRTAFSLLIYILRPGVLDCTRRTRLPRPLHQPALCTLERLALVGVAPGFNMHSTSPSDMHHHLPRTLSTCLIVDSVTCVLFSVRIVSFISNVCIQPCVLCTISTLRLKNIVWAMQCLCISAFLFILT